MNRGITVQTVVGLHCDGPPHNYEEVVMDGHLSPSLVDDIREAWGFTVADDGRVFCRLHTPHLKGSVHDA